MEEHLIVNRFDEQYDDLISKTGGFNNFQKFYLSGMLSGLLSYSWILYGLTFYELMPKDFECQFPQSNVWVQCDKSQFCANSQIIYRIAFQSNDDLQNWVPKLNLECQPSYIIGLIGSSYFIGFASTLLWVPRLADIYGRLLIYQISMFINLILICSYYFWSNVYLVIGTQFLIGCATTGRVCVGYVFMCEFIKIDQQPLLSTIWCFIDGFTFLFITLYFRLIATNWTWITLIGVIQATWSVITITSLSESPKFLLKQKRYEEAEVILKKISQWNKTEFRQDIQQYCDGINQNLDENKNESLMNYLKDFKIQRRLIIMSMFWLTSSFNYYLIQFQLKYFPGDIYLNSCIFSCCGIIAYASGPFIYNNLGIKYTFFSLNFIAGLGGLLILLWGQNVSNPYVFPSLVLFASFGTAACFNLIYGVHGHVFTTLFSSTAMGICNLVSRFSTIFAPQIAEISVNTSMTVFTLLNLISVILSLFIDSPLRPKKNKI